VSKTDPFRKGVAIYLGRTDNDLCPVGAIAAYLAVRDRHPGPFFKFATGAPLSRVGLVSNMKSSLAVIRGGCIQVCGIQLLNWGCHHGGFSWHRRLPDQDPGEVGERSILVCEVPAGQAVVSVKATVCSIGD